MPGPLGLFEMDPALLTISVFGLMVTLPGIRRRVDCRMLEWLDNKTVLQPGAMLQHPHWEKASDPSHVCHGCLEAALPTLTDGERYMIMRTLDWRLLSIKEIITALARGGRRARFSVVVGVRGFYLQGDKIVIVEPPVTSAVTSAGVANGGLALDF